MWTRRRFLHTSAAASLPLLLGAACGTERRALEISSEAQALHDESLVLDLHIDSLLWTRLFDYDIAARHRNRLPASPFGHHMDLPRAREGGLDAAVMGLVVNPDEEREGLILPLRFLARWEDERGFDHLTQTQDLLRGLAERRPEEIVFARSGSELMQAVESGRFGALSGLEGGHGISGDLANVERAHAGGLRMLGLVHFQPTAAGYPMTSPQFDERGLLPFGLELIDELHRLGIVADLAHLNSAGLHDAFARLRHPFVVSHSGCKALHPNPRNLDDEELRALGEAGGVVGIAFGRSFLGGDWGVPALLDHIEHALNHAGNGAVALGSDYDGFIVPVAGLGDVRCYPLITQGLLDRGVAPDVVRGVLGGNALRVLVEVTG